MVTQAEIVASQSKLEQERAELETEAGQLDKERQEAEASAQEYERIASTPPEPYFTPFGNKPDAIVEDITRRRQLDYQTQLEQSRSQYEQKKSAYGQRVERYKQRASIFEGKIGEFNKQAEVYNKQQDEFVGFLQKVAEGKESVEDVTIQTYRYGDYGGFYSTRSKLGDRYGEGTTDVASRGWEQKDLEQYAIDSTKGYLRLGAEDVIRINGRVVQESSFTPEQIATANQVFSGRMAALAEWENARQIERRDLQSRREGATEFYAKDTAKTTELIKQSGGLTPTQQVEFLKDNLKGSYAKETIEGLQWKVGEETITKPEMAEQYITQLNTAQKLKLIEQGYVETPLHSPEGGRVWVKKQEEWKMPEEINPATGKRWSEPAPIQDSSQNLNKQWEATYSGRFAGTLSTKMGVAEQSITEWQNKKYMGAPDVPRIFLGGVAKGAIGLGGVVVGAGIVGTSFIEAPALAWTRLKTATRVGITTLPSSTYEMFAKPVRERGVIGGSAENIGQLTAFYYGGKVIGRGYGAIKKPIVTRLPSISIPKTSFGQIKSFATKEFPFLTNERAELSFVTAKKVKTMDEFFKEEAVLWESQAPKEAVIEVQPIKKQPTKRIVGLSDIVIKEATEIVEGKPPTTEQFESMLRKSGKQPFAGMPTSKGLFGDVKASGRFVEESPFKRPKTDVSKLNRLSGIFGKPKPAIEVKTLPEKTTLKNQKYGRKRIVTLEDIAKEKGTVKPKPSVEKEIRTSTGQILILKQELKQKPKLKPLDVGFDMGLKSTTKPIIYVIPKEKAKQQQNRPKITVTTASAKGFLKKQGVQTQKPKVFTTTKPFITTKSAIATRTTVKAAEKVKTAQKLRSASTLKTPTLLKTPTIQGVRQPLAVRNVVAQKTPQAVRTAQRGRTKTIKLQKSEFVGKRIKQPKKTSSKKFLETTRVLLPGQMLSTLKSKAKRGMGAKSIIKKSIRG